MKNTNGHNAPTNALQAIKQGYILGFSVIALVAMGFFVVYAVCSALPALIMSAIPVITYKVALGISLIFFLPSFLLFFSLTAGVIARFLSKYF